MASTPRRLSQYLHLASLLLLLLINVIVDCRRLSLKRVSSGLDANNKQDASRHQYQKIQDHHQQDPAAYKCAQFCTCSLVVQIQDSVSIAGNDIQVLAGGPLAATSSKVRRRSVSLTRAMCESSQFSDVLTIDRRTQIIHISLPPSPTTQDDQQEQQGRSDTSSANRTTTEEPVNPKAKGYNSKRKQLNLMTKLLNLNVSSSSSKEDDNATTRAAIKFRMPRLMQFNQLREILIVNLRIEACDSEVFKRGQRLLKLKWNHNQLKQVSKNCFRHLDKLQELNLDHNRLEELESALFSQLISLRHLSLAHNQLSELAAHQFANLSQLVSLNLLGNNFKVINLNLFEPMQNSLQLLTLAKNQIRSFVVNQPTGLVSSSAVLQPNGSVQQPQMQQSPFSGVIFKNLIKLNVDSNRLERVKLLQLQRFFNVKFLSIRQNQIATIRDKAFNGLKLVELNLSQNKLVSISRCAFCNSTIKRLNLAQNNISMPLLPAAMAAGASAASLVASGHQLTAAQLPTSTSTSTSTAIKQPEPLILAAPSGTPAAASSASMLVLGQSILGPLYNQLEYLDLSSNEQLGGVQLEYLLEPLLELQYLNLAAVGLDRSLPTPNLFKNSHHLRYLNLSLNQLDQLVAETVEPLQELELLDLSRNDFNELDESLLVALDELPLLKFVSFASNPWYCSQCKISPLYEWILRSPIYNSTCLTQQLLQDGGAATTSRVDPVSEETLITPASSAVEEDEPELVQPEAESDLGFIYKHQNSQARGPTFKAPESPSSATSLSSTSVDFELIFDLFQDDSALMGALDEVASRSPMAQQQPSNSVPNYLFSDGAASLQTQFRAKKRQLADRLMRSLSSEGDDDSILRTISSVQAAGQLLVAADGSALSSSSDSSESSSEQQPNSELFLRQYFPQADFCLKCEFPSELRSFNLHELTPTDFKYCPGSAPRFTASEPKIGLTLAIVIIGVLFVVIIVVIVMYRKKSNTYYPGEDLTDQLEAGASSNQRGKNQPVLSISSDMDHQYGDATDYSSPPMSQSYSGESYTGDENSGVDEDEEEEEEEEDEEFDEDEEEEEELDEEEEEEEEEEELDDEEEEENIRDEMDELANIDDDDNDHDRDHHDHTGPSRLQPSGGGESHHHDGGGPSTPNTLIPQQEHHHHHHHQHDDAKTHHPKVQEEVTQTDFTNANKKPPPQASKELPAGQTMRTPTGGGSSAATSRNSPAVSEPAKSAARRHANKSQGSHGTGSSASRPPSKQLTHNDRDDSTPIFIAALKKRHESSIEDKTLHKAASGGAKSSILSPGSSLERRPSAGLSSAAPTPASLSDVDLMNAGSPSLFTSSAGAANTTTDGSGPLPAVSDPHHSHLHNQNRSGSGGGRNNKLAQMATLAGSPHESYSRHKRPNGPADDDAQTQSGDLSPTRAAHHQKYQDHAGQVDIQQQPKTLLHHQHANQQLQSATQTGDSLSQRLKFSRHRQSSEQSGTAAVSFAADGGAPAMASNDSTTRRERMRRVSQTIGGPATVRDPVAEGHPGSGGPERHPQQHHRHQHVSSIRLNSSNGRQQQHERPTVQPLQATLHPVAPTAVSLKQRLESSGETRDPTGDWNSSPNLPATGRQRVESRSNSSARQALALRGRPLVKQPYQAPPPHQQHHNKSPLEFDGPLNSHVLEDEQQQEVHVVGGPQHEAESEPLEDEPSLDLEAQMADLPSDLDESNIELFALGDSSINNNSHKLHHHSGAVLEFNEDEDEDEDEDDELDARDELMQLGLRGLGLGQGQTSIRASNSTHSALTQTGSRDFE